MKKKKEKNKRINGYKIIGFLLLICSIILLGVVLYIDILPVKYLIALGGILLFINLILDFFLFRKKIKKKPKKIATIFSLLFSCLFLIGSFFIFKTFGVLDNMSQNYKTYTYHILVKNDSSYKNIEDIGTKKLGYYNDNSKSTTKALKKLDTVVKTENESYGNLDGLGSSLLNSEVEAILVEDSQKIKLDNANSNNFKNSVITLYTFKVKLKIENGIDVAKNTFNIYISGMDEYGKVSEISRSDVNMILTINPKTKQILMTNVPRDYYVQLHDTTGYKDKLTHAGIYGVDTSIKTLEDLLGIKLDYYFKVNFSSLENIIDALDGVDVYSEYDFQSWNGYNFTKGYNHVKGKAALAFARERHTFTDGDNQRGKNQQALIEAIFRKCTSPSIITKYNSLLNSLEDSMITDMPTKSITALAKMQLKDNAKWTITSNSLVGTGSYDYTYTYNYQELYVMVPDEDSITKAKDEISKVAGGELLKSSYDSEASDIHSVSKSQVSKSNYSSYSNSSTKKKNTTTKKSTGTKKKNTETVKKDNSVVNTPTDNTKNNDSNSNSSSSSNNNSNNNSNTNGNGSNSSGVPTPPIDSNPSESGSSESGNDNSQNSQTGTPENNQE